MNWSTRFLIVYLCLLLVAPVLSTHNPQQTNPSNTHQPPSALHFFGTDNLGRDVYSRTLHGGQRTILIASLAASIAISSSLVLAILTIVRGEVAHQITTIILNAVLAFPSLLIALVTLTLLGRGFLPIAIATGIAQLPYYLQVSLSVMQQEQSRDYILAARSLGAPSWRIALYHILPNILPTLTAYATVTFSYCIINGAALSLLGLSGDPSIPDWGVMLASGRTAFRTAPWAILAPAVAISLTVILMNRIAE